MELWILFNQIRISIGQSQGRTHRLPAPLRKRAEHGRRHHSLIGSHLILNSDTTEAKRVKSNARLVAVAVGRTRELREVDSRESGTERLEQAVEAYQAALEEYTRERVSLDWAMTQMNLGNALKTLGERTDQKSPLETALKAMKNASIVYLKEAGQIHHEAYFRERIEEIEAAIIAVTSK